MRITAFVLLLAMLASMAACGSDAPADDTTADVQTTTAASTDTEPLDALEARKLVDDELPDKDFEGAALTILGEASKEAFLDSEGANGEVVNDAVYARNQAVEERFNVKLEYLLVDKYQDLGTQITNNVNAGDDSFQLVTGHVVGLGSLALNDYMMNWYDLEHINFDKPWWAKATRETLTYNDVCILAIGDYALSAMTSTYCVYFNKRLTEEYKISDPYQTVLDGKWTIDYLIQTTKDIYQDVNNNEIDDEADFYGFLTNAGSHANAYLWAFDNPIIAEDPDEGLTVVYKSNKINDIITKLVTMHDDNLGITHMGYLNNGSFTYRLSGANVIMFPNGQLVFATGGIENAVKNFRDMEDEYGILPYPKWDENQEEYYTMVDGSHSAMCVPVTVEDTEMVGIITEALCAESYKQVVPAYYDTALKVKGTRDETSVEILDMLVANRVFDMGYVYDGWKGASFIIQNMVRNSNTNFESYWAGKESSILARYQDVIDYFENYGK